MGESITAIGSAAIGALAAIGATWWSMRRATQASLAEQHSSERSSLEALLLEMDVVAQIAGVGSLAGLPTQMLQNSLPGIHHMGSRGKADLVAYSGAVLRYNGRAGRITQFEVAKRMNGQRGHAEKVSAEHVDPVLAAIASARSTVESQLASPRLAPRSLARPGD